MRVDALVVVIDRDGQGSLGALLADHVLVEDILDFAGSRDLGNRFGNFALFVLRQDLIAERDALIANVDRRSGDELPNRILGFAAEGAAQVLVVGHR